MVKCAKLKTSDNIIIKDRKIMSEMSPKEELQQKTKQNMLLRLQNINRLVKTAKATEKDLEKDNNKDLQEKFNNAIQQLKSLQALMCKAYEKVNSSLFAELNKQTTVPIDALHEISYHSMLKKSFQKQEQLCELVTNTINECKNFNNIHRHNKLIQLTINKLFEFSEESAKLHQLLTFLRKKTQQNIRKHLKSYNKIYSLAVASARDVSIILAIIKQTQKKLKDFKVRTDGKGTRFKQATEIFKNLKNSQSKEEFTTLQQLFEKKIQKNKKKKKKKKNKDIQIKISQNQPPEEKQLSEKELIAKLQENSFKLNSIDIEKEKAEQKEIDGLTEEHKKNLELISSNNNNAIEQQRKIEELKKKLKLAESVLSKTEKTTRVAKKNNFKITREKTFKKSRQDQLEFRRKFRNEKPTTLAEADGNINKLLAIQENLNIFPEIKEYSEKIIRQAEEKFNYVIKSMHQITHLLYRKTLSVHDMCTGIQDANSPYIRLLFGENHNIKNENLLRLCDHIQEITESHMQACFNLLKALDEKNINCIKLQSISKANFNKINELCSEKKLPTIIKNNCFSLDILAKLADNLKRYGLNDIVSEVINKNNKPNNRFINQARTHKPIKADASMKTVIKKLNLYIKEIKKLIQHLKKCDVPTCFSIFAKSLQTQNKIKEHINEVKLYLQKAKLTKTANTLMTSAYKDKIKQPQSTEKAKNALKENLPKINSVQEQILRTLLSGDKQISIEELKNMLSSLNFGYKLGDNKHKWKLHNVVFQTHNQHGKDLSGNADPQFLNTIKNKLTELGVVHENAQIHLKL